MANIHDGSTRSKNSGELIRWAVSYDRLVSVLTLGLEGWFRQRSIAAAKLSEGQRVLDVGCGTGTLAVAAVAAVGSEGRVEGIDPSPEMIARAKSRALASGGQAHFHEAGIESLRFPDCSFDSVMSSLVFHHLDDSLQRAGLEEIHRVLAPGGRLTIIDFAAGGHCFLLRLAARFPHHGSEGHTLPDNGFEDLASKASEVGFHNVCTATFKPRFLSWLSA